MVCLGSLLVACTYGGSARVLRSSSSKTTISGGPSVGVALRKLPQASNEAWLLSSSLQPEVEYDVEGSSLNGGFLWSVAGQHYRGNNAIVAAISVGIIFDGFSPHSTHGILRLEVGFERSLPKPDWTSTSVRCVPPSGGGSDVDVARQRSHPWAFRIAPVLQYRSPRWQGTTTDPEFAGWYYGLGVGARKLGESGCPCGTSEVP